MLLCVFFSLTNQVCNCFEFLGKTYFVVENLKREYLKILDLGKLGLNLLFWKSISSHTHAFYFFYSTHLFSKVFKLSSLSPTRQGSTNKFFVVFLLISCKVFLSISRYVHYTLSFSFIFSFTCIFSCIGGLFFGLCINLGF